MCHYSIKPSGSCFVAIGLMPKDTDIANYKDVSGNLWILMVNPSKL